MAEVMLYNTVMIVVWILLGSKKLAVDYDEANEKQIT